MMFRSTIRLCFLMAYVSLPVLMATAAGPIVPDGLKPGDRYYLAFLTHDGRPGNDGEIKTYNDFVNAQAAQKDSLAGGASWVAIASTAKVDAIDNLDFANQSLIAPIYLLDGKTMIVKQAKELFSGDNLLNPINIDQFGKASTARNVWTGTGTDGKKADPLGGSPATRGDPQEVGAFWISRGAGPSQFDDGFYAVSRLLTVVPEPSAWILLGTGIAGSFVMGGRVRSHHSPVRPGVDDGPRED